MDLLNISEIKYNKDTVFYEVIHFPYSLDDVREAILSYLQNQCKGIRGIGNRCLLDFVAVTALLCGNNAPWSRLLFDETVAQNLVPVTFYPVDFLGFLNRDTIAIVDYCDMDSKKIIGEAYKEIPKIAIEKYIMGEKKNRRILYFLEAIEKGVLTDEYCTIVLGQQYIDGDYKAFKKLLEKVDRNQILKKSWITDFISCLMPYGKNSFYDWYHFFL